MLLVKDIRGLNYTAKSRWAGKHHRAEYFSKFKWAVVDHAHTEWETVLACFFEYEDAKHYTRAMHELSAPQLDLIRQAYQRYGDTHRWTTFQGEAIPRWEELPEAEKLAWVRAILPLLSSAPNSP